MSDDKPDTGQAVQTADQLLASVKSELLKGQREKAKAKLKEPLAKIEELKKSMRLAEAEVEKILDDYSKGLL